MASISRTQRWLDLIAYLVGRRLPVPVEELMDHIPAYAQRWRGGSGKDRATVRRAFERDKDALRDMGIPIETVTYTVDWEDKQGYRLAERDFYLPYVRLLAQTVGEAAPGRGRGGGGGGRRRGTGAANAAAFELHADDAESAIDGLRHVLELPEFPLAAEARSALRKLTFDLHPADFPRTPVLYVEPPGSTGLRDNLRALTDALIARKRVRFRYHGIYRDRETERDVAPFGLLFRGGHWYLIGHDALRDDVRVFRVGRMADLDPNRSALHTPDYEIPEDFRLEDYRSRAPWRLGKGEEPPVRARVEFDFPASLWAERNGYGRLERRRTDGGQVRTFEIEQVGPFIRWLLALEGEARVLAPPELRRETASVAAEVAALYGAKPADDGPAGGVRA